MNISLAKVGIAAYARTAWFGKRQHSGEVYANEITSLVGNGDGVLAACADNTSSNTSMQKGLFGKLSELYMWFFIGCCVHAMDLLSEDIAKLSEIAQIISDCKFIVLFVIRFPMISETFLDLQKNRRKTNPKASMLGLKTFPDTRFAYAFFMMYSVYVNWSCLSALTDTPEFKLMKRSASGNAEKKAKRRAQFLKFERLVGSADTRQRAEGAIGVMQPVSSALHYLEGDDVESSHVAPVFVVLDQQNKSPVAEVTDVFDESTLDSIKSAFSDRWNGAGSKVGVKHDVHCLAFKIDPVLRCAIEVGLGAEMLAAIDGAFRRTAWDNALLTYSKGSDPVYSKLLSEYTKFASKSGDYATLWRQANSLAKTAVAEVVEQVDSDTKENKLKLFLKLLRHKNEDGTPALSSRSLMGAVSNDDSATMNEKLFANMTVDVLSIVTQACAVERINKSHGFVHNKARAAMANRTTFKSLYIFTNECLLKKLSRGGKRRHAEPQLTSFEVFIANTASAPDADEVLSKLVHANVADYLPAERSDRTTQRARNPRTGEGMDEDDDDDDAMPEDSDDSSDDDEPDAEDDEIDDGFVYLDDPSPPDGFESYDMPEPAEFIRPSVIESEKRWYLLLCIDDLSWWLGKIKSYSARARKWNFQIQWGPAGAPEQQSAKLENYFRPESGDTAASGHWMYLSQSRLRPSTRRGRDEIEVDGDGDGDRSVHSDDESFESPAARARSGGASSADSGGGGGGGSGIYFFIFF